MKEIQTVKDSWKEYKLEYLANHPGDKKQAKAAHFADWLSDYEEAIAELAGQFYGYTFTVEEVREALQKAKGDVHAAVAALEDEVDLDDIDPRTEALTPAQRNPGLTNG